MAKYAPLYMKAYDFDGPGVALAALTLSANTFAANAAIGTAVGNVEGNTEGSVLSLSGDDAALFALDGLAVELASGTIAAGSYDVNVVETHDNGYNSPRTTAFVLTAS